MGRYNPNARSQSHSGARLHFFFQRKYLKFILSYWIQTNGFFCTLNHSHVINICWTFFNFVWNGRFGVANCFFVSCFTARNSSTSTLFVFDLSFMDRIIWMTSVLSKIVLFLADTKHAWGWQIVWKMIVTLVKTILLLQRQLITIEITNIGIECMDSSILVHDKCIYCKGQINFQYTSNFSGIALRLEQLKP